MLKHILRLTALLILAAVLSACGSRTPNPQIEPTETAQPASPTETQAAPAPTATSTAEVPSRPTQGPTSPPVTEAYPAPAEVNSASGGVDLAAGYPAPGEEISPLSVPVTTYQNLDAGFQLDYPETWQIVDVDLEVIRSGRVYTVTLSSWQVRPGSRQGEGIPTGETKIDITVFPETASDLDEGLEKWRAVLAQSSPGAEVVSEEEWTLAGGLLAVREEVQGTKEPVVNLVTVLNGNTIVLTGLGDFNTFDQIAKTLRAYNP